MNDNINNVTGEITSCAMITSKVSFFKASY